MARSAASRFAGAMAAIAVVLGVWGAASAWGNWTTYRGDSGRSGVDSSGSGSVPFSSAWASASLDGDVWGQSLVYGGLVVVATENDSVYALSESTGQVVWRVNVGTAVPAGQLPCGDISPTVGITSTPVIDPGANRVFVVADTWDGTHVSSIQHKMFALNLADGSVVPGFPAVVDPPGNIPADLLQRAALALDGGKVFAGFGGNDGDCGTYHGWLVGVPESGGSPINFEVAANQVGGAGAIWGAGDGPAVDSSGDLWVETGNGFGTSYGYQESVLRLDTNLNLLDYWAPSNWQYLDANDIDLGSGEPLLLPNRLVFAIGKAGMGYLLSASNLGGLDAAPVYSAQVCGQTIDASFGGAVYYLGVIYVTCTDGLRALSLNTSTQTFGPVRGWQVNSSAVGPPIIAGGLVWVTNRISQQLFGLNLQTGQAVVDQSTPAMEHFVTPSASDGKLYLAAGRTIDAYNIANATATTTTPTTTTTTTTTSTTTPTTPTTTTTTTPTLGPVVSPRDPAPTGRLIGKTLGRLRLGMTRAQARQQYAHGSTQRKHYTDFFALTGGKIRVGYASPRLLETLSSRQRRALEGRVVLALTANPYYALHGIRPGTSLRTAAQMVHLGAVFHVGLNDWYGAPDGTSTAVLKVRHGTVQEIGIADATLTRTRHAQRTLITSLS